jgi:hypothetical protein
MENKFTLRDFLVYLLTGFSLFIFCIPLIYKEIFLFLNNNKQLLKDFSSIIVILFLLTFYLIGHIIQSIDLIKYLIIGKRF